MGEKELTPGFLVFPDGTKVGVTEPTFLSVDTSDMKDLTCIDNTPIDNTLVFHEVEFSPILLWQFLTGMKITNNYLKMHGGVMMRYRQIRKLNKKRRK